MSVSFGIVTAEAAAVRPKQPQERTQHSRRAEVVCVDDRDDEPWDRSEEIVPASLVDGVVGPDGLVDARAGLATSTCPVVPELLRQAG